MRRPSVVKFPHSLQLFRFCQKILGEAKTGKVHDQEIGAILDYNPSDCSHWKRGEKNIKSVFSLNAIANHLNVDVGLIFDLASGATVVEEAYYEHTQTKLLQELGRSMAAVDAEVMNALRKKVEAFSKSLAGKAGFSIPPLYLPEVIRLFPMASCQSIEMLDKLSRVLRVKPGTYVLQFKKGELSAQTRMSMTTDFAGPIARQGKIVRHVHHDQLGFIHVAGFDLSFAGKKIFFGPGPVSGAVGLQLNYLQIL